jgi:hypothetical protein
VFKKANQGDGSNADGREMDLSEFRKSLQLVGRKIGIALETDEDIAPLLPSKRSPARRSTSPNKRSTSPMTRGGNSISPRDSSPPQRAARQTKSPRGAQKP